MGLHNALYNWTRWQTANSIMTAKNIKIRIYRGRVPAIGPGKADLLEAIAESGSISAAARVMGMSYKRAWDLVDAMNNSFKRPLVITATGGARGGGAQVTEFGQDVLRRYRELETKAAQSVLNELSALNALLAD
jgi:molybdate transport system regulatory protein